MARDTEWRKKELSLSEVLEKYPDVPKIVGLKIDIARRGLAYTQTALDRLDPEIHQVNKGGIFFSDKRPRPVGLFLRDGSYILTNFDTVPDAQRDNYLVDVVDDKIYITDEGKLLEEVTYWEKPGYYGKKASNGVPMENYAVARPQRLDVALRSECHYWDTPGEGCKYCTWHTNFVKSGKPDIFPDKEIVVEVIREALKDRGRFASIMFGQGTYLAGKEVFDEEVNEEVELFQLIGERLFGDPKKKFPSTLVANAYNDKQLEKLAKETGLMTYTADLEILDHEKFDWICPGKKRFVGYDEWKRRLNVAVELFGWGNVTSSVVIGAEQAKPNGFTSEEEAYHVITEEAESVISHGIAIAGNVWVPSPGAMFQKQDTPSLDFYVRTLRELNRLHHKYDVRRFADDYRRCGAHPGLDLLRI